MPDAAIITLIALIGIASVGVVIAVERAGERRGLATSINSPFRCSRFDALMYTPMALVGLAIVLVNTERLIDTYPNGDATFTIAIGLPWTIGVAVISISGWRGEWRFCGSQLLARRVLRRDKWSLVVDLNEVTAASWRYHGDIEALYFDLPPNESGKDFVRAPYGNLRSGDSKRFIRKLESLGVEVPPEPMY